ncbi:unnamed protein product [Echinostoma caproni]|uniref:Uncharacterized protein n=1 Tax=Echinostoma caproni TaxID=27848 RepID=A0A183B1N7_9TREM|nr:unnamed protein product [Echinostoma caproni]
METARRESQIETMVRRNELEVLGTIASIQAPNAGPRRPPYFPDRRFYTSQHRRLLRFEKKHLSLTAATVVGSARKPKLLGITNQVSHPPFVLYRSVLWKITLSPLLFH